MPKILSLFFLFSQFAFSQEIKYRFQSAFSLQTIINSGQRSFEGLSKMENTDAVHEQEVYKIDYKNNTASLGFNWKVGVNWAIEKKYSIRQTFAVFGEMYQEEIQFELTAKYGEILNASPQFENVEEGYTGTAILNGLGYGANSELLYFYHLKNGWKAGGGLSYTARFRNDIVLRQVDYVPNHQHLTYGHYWTKQLGVSAQLEKSSERWTYFINFNQAIATLKGKNAKGARYFQDGEVLHPISHNMDFRFPFTIQFGAAVQFRKTRN